MQFSDTSDLQGIIQDITFHTSVDTNQYKLADRVRRINQWYYRLIMDVIKAVRSNVFQDTSIGNYTDGDWTYDAADGSYTRDLVAGTRSYQLPTTRKPWIIYKVAYMRDGEMLYSANPFHVGVIGNQMNAATIDANIPQTQPLYRFNGDNIIPLPSPNINVPNGLKIWAVPEPTGFTITDTIKIPEINKAFHDGISLGASYDYLRAKDKTRAQQLKNDLEQIRDELRTYASSFLDDEQPVMKSDLDSNYGA